MADCTPIDASPLGMLRTHERDVRRWRELGEAPLDVAAAIPEVAATLAAAFAAAKSKTVCEPVPPLAAAMRKCTGRESNPYALRRRNLNPLRLPVSPPVRFVSVVRQFYHAGKPPRPGSRRPAQGPFQSRTRHRTRSRARDGESSVRDGRSDLSRRRIDSASRRVDAACLRIARGAHAPDESHATRPWAAALEIMTDPQAEWTRPRPVTASA